MNNIAYIGLGSNIEPRDTYLNEAIQMLERNPKINLEKQSSIYETAPVGYTEQDSFLNMVIEINTSLKSIDLLKVCQEVEQEFGRKRTIKNGPRTIDLDILFYNREYRYSEILQLPHPRIHERAFVLVPLCEIASDLSMPTSGMPVSDLLMDLPEKEKSDVVKWEKIK